MKRLLFLAILISCTFGCRTETVVNGELFVVTKGAGNYKLGGVPVAAYLRHDFIIRGAPFKAGIEKTIENASKAREQCVKGVSFDTSEVVMRNEIGKCYAEEEKTELEAVEKIFGAELSPKAIGKTNGDGKFSMTLSQAGEYLIFARASRTAGDVDEQYLFMQPVKAEGKELNLVVSNTELTSAEGLVSGVLK